MNSQHHGYKMGPNVHFSPDGKWIIFQANFEGREQVFAVDIQKRNTDDTDWMDFNEKTLSLLANTTV